MQIAGIQEKTLRRQALAMLFASSLGVPAPGRGAEGEQEVKDMRAISWFGADAGPMFVGSLNENNELSKSGYSLGLKSGFSYLTDVANFEIGLAWMLTVIEASGKGQSPINPDAADVPEGVRVSQVRTRFGVGNLAVRFRLTDNVEVGPTAAVIFGTDTSFSPEANPPNTSPNVMFGANMALLIKKPRPDSLFACRFFAQYLRGLSIEERSVQMLNFGVDFGFGIAHEKPQVIVKERIKTRYKTQVKVVTKVEKDVRVVPQVEVREHYLVDAGIVNFETAKDHMQAGVEMYLRHLSALLLSRPNDWERIMIRSHTDKRGTFAYNAGLSAQRAHAVQSVFQASGLAQTRLEIQSKVYVEPVDDKNSSLALAKNRRVEIFVRGGRRTDALKQEIIKLQQMYRMPSTCSGLLCR